MLLLKKNISIASLLIILAILNCLDSIGQSADSNLFISRSSRYVLPTQKDSLWLTYDHQKRKDLFVVNGLWKFNRLASVREFSGIKPALPQFQSPIDLKGPILSVGKAHFSAEFDNTSSNTDNSQMSPYQTSEMFSSLSVWSIPFSFGYNSHSGFQNSSDRLDFLMTHFDKETFLDQVKEKLNKAAKPEDLFNVALKKLYETRDRAFNTIKADLTAALKTRDDKLLPGIQDKMNIENISGLGVDQFLNNIVKENLAGIETRENELIRIQNNNVLPDSAYRIAREIEKLRSSKGQLQDKVGALRNKWFTTGLLQTIGSFEKEKQATIRQLMNDPATVVKMASEKLRFSFLQRLLLNTKSLSIGSSGIDQSKLGINDALVKGFNLEYLKGNRLFAPVLGVMPGVRNLTDFSYANYSELPDISAIALRMGKGDIQDDFSHLSVSLFQPGNNSQHLFGSGFKSALPKNLVTTFSRRMSFGAVHSLLAEFSKSTMIYSPGSGVKDNGIKGMMSAANFLGNMGLNLDYSGDYESIGIVNRVSIRYTGKEYNNLGDYSLASGSRELSNDLRKSFLKRKLVVNVKTNYREYAFSTDGRKWKSYSYTADAKWKFKKGEFIEIRYQPYFNRRVSTDENYISSKAYRVALRGNINRKVMKGFTYRNFLELTSFNDSFYDFFRDKFISSGFVSFTSQQTLNVGQQTLFFNITANMARENTGYLYGNSSLTMDGGMAFNAIGKISLSSALAYNGVSKMYGQLSIRQSISAALGGRIVLDGYITAGKNLNMLDGLCIPAITGNVSISYQLK